MTRTRYIQIGAAIVAVALTAWGASRVLERVVSPVPQQSTAAAAGSAVASVPHIIATLYYANSDGQSLDRKSTRLNSSHSDRSRMPSSA